MGRGGESQIQTQTQRRNMYCKKLISLTGRESRLISVISSEVSEYSLLGLLALAVATGWNEIKKTGVVY